MSEEDVPGDGQARRRREEGCRRPKGDPGVAEAARREETHSRRRRRGRVWGSAARETLRDTSPFGRVWSEALAGEAIVERFLRGDPLNRRPLR